MPMHRLIFPHRLVQTCQTHDKIIEFILTDPHTVDRICKISIGVCVFVRFTTFTYKNYQISLAMTSDDPGRGSDMPRVCCNYF